MDIDEFIEEMKIFYGNYGKVATKELLDSWFEIFEQFDREYFHQIVMQLIKTKKYLPNANEILEEMKKIKFEVITEEQKIKKWEKTGIKPDWYKDDTM